MHLAVHDDGWVVYLEKAESRHPVAPVSRIGDRVPAHLVATGRAILAYLPEEQLDAEIVAETRRRGWALNRDSYREGVSGVAAPIRDCTGGVVASIGCCFPPGASPRTPSRCLWSGASRQRRGSPPSSAHVST